MFLRGHQVGLWRVPCPICPSTGTMGTLSTALPGAPLPPLPALAHPHSAASLPCTRPRHLDPEHFLQTNKFILWHFLQPVYIRTRLPKASSGFSFEARLAAHGEASSLLVEWQVASEPCPPHHTSRCALSENVLSSSV